MTGKLTVSINSTLGRVRVITFKGKLEFFSHSHQNVHRKKFIRSKDEVCLRLLPLDRGQPSQLQRKDYDNESDRHAEIFEKGLEFKFSFATTK